MLSVFIFYSDIMGIKIQKDLLREVVGKVIMIFRQRNNYRTYSVCVCVCNLCDMNILFQHLAAFTLFQIHCNSIMLFMYVNLFQLCLLCSFSVCSKKLQIVSQNSLLVVNKINNIKPVLFYMYRNDRYIILGAIVNRSSVLYVSFTSKSLARIFMVGLM